MNEKSTQLPAHTDVHEHLLDQQQRREQAKKTWRFMGRMAIAFILLIITFIQLKKYQNVGKFPSWSDLFGSKHEVQFPPEVADWDGPNEVARFVDELHGMFSDITEEEECCPHHHEYDWNHNTQQKIQTNNKQSCGKLGIAFPPEYARHPRPPRRHEPFCRRNELTPSSAVYTFSPDDYQRAAVFLDGDFSRGSHVTVDRGSDDDDEKDIKVNVTLYAGHEKLLDQVSISGFDHQGQYAVQVKRKGYHHHHHCKKPHVKKDCLLYDIHIVFPSHLTSFDVLDLHVREASRIGTNTPSELTKLEFNKFRAGLGHGAIIFKDLKAKQTMLATLHGIVMGHYSPTERFGAATVKGATKVFVNPASNKIHSTVVATIGPASAAMPADGFKGNFAVHTWTGSPIVKAPNPNDVHVVKNTHTLKAGYYKEEDTGSKVVVHSKHGDSELIFRDSEDELRL